MNPKQLYSIISDALKLTPGEINDELKLSDVSNWDSFKHMELIAKLENYYQIQFEFEEIAAMQNIGQIKKIVASKS